MRGPLEVDPAATAEPSGVPASASALLRRRARIQRLRRGAPPEPVERDPDRPVTRGDCADAPRPCPWVSCKYHMYIDVNPETGSVKINAPDSEPWELAESCALDVAERGGMTLEVISNLLHLTKERVRQIEVRALRKLHAGEYLERGGELADAAHHFPDRGGSL